MQNLYTWFMIYKTVPKYEGKYTIEQF